MQAYSLDLRERVLADSDAGMNTKALAERYRVSASWVRKLKQQRRDTGQIGPRPQRVSHATKLDDHLDHLKRLVAAKPDSTLAEFCEQMPVAVSVATMWRALKRLKLTLKKSPAGGRAGSAGRGREARPVASWSSRPRPAAAGVSR